MQTKKVVCGPRPRYFP
jgi:hypothetical protein